MPRTPSALASILVALLALSPSPAPAQGEDDAEPLLSAQTPVRLPWADVRALLEKRREQDPPA
ncbi:MAG: hypothetical protein ACYC8T_38475, partial [Myxococcaceae bacterium]